MTILPIVTRELSVGSRRPRTYRLRMAAALVALATVVWLLLTAPAQVPPSLQGRMLFSFLSTAAFVFCLSVGIGTTADCISSEKRDGTLGLLFLTDLKGFDIILGKLVSSSVDVIYALLGFLPVLALAILFGGITQLELIRTAAILMETLLFSLATGLMVSTVSREDRKGMFATALILLLITGGPYVLASYFAFNQAGAIWMPLDHAFLTPSPFFALSLANLSKIPAGSNEFLKSAVWLLSLTLAELGLASMVLPRVCQERIARSSDSKAKTRRTARRFEAALAKRRTVLAHYPFAWLSARDKLKPKLPWVFIAAIVIIWIWTFHQVGVFILSWAYTLGALFFVAGFFKIWMAAEVCSRLGPDCRNGLMELLVTTPLGAEGVARGQLASLRRQFIWPGLALLLAIPVLVLADLFAYPSGIEFSTLLAVLGSGAAVWLADSLTIPWVAMQESAAGNSRRALMRAVGLVLVLPWLVFMLVRLLGATYEFLNQRGLPLRPFHWVIVWLVICLAIDFHLASRARRRFLFSLPQQLIGEPLAEPDGGDASLQADREPGRARTRSGFGRAVWTRRLAVGVAMAFVVCMAAHFGWKHWRLHREIQRRLEAIRRSGQLVRAADLPTGNQTPIPPNSNAAEAFTDAGLLLTSGVATFPYLLSNWEPGRFYGFGEREQAARELLEANRPALDVLRAELARPFVRFHRNSLGFPSGIDWNQIRLLNQLVQLEFYLAFRRHDQPGEMRALETLLRLSWVYGQEAFLPSFAATFFHADTARLASIDLAVLLGQEPMSDEETDRLEAGVKYIEASSDLAREISFLRAIRIDGLDRPPLFRQASAGSLFEQVRQSVLEDWRAWSGKTEEEFIFFLESIERYHRAAELAVSARFIQSRQVHDWVQQQDWAHRGGFRSQGLLELDGVENLFESETHCQACVNFALAALAIERWKRANGNTPPAKLEMLVPAFLRRVPTDPFNGRPLGYQRTATGYVLFSAGPESWKSDAPGAPFARFRFTVGEDPWKQPPPPPRWRWIRGGRRYVRPKS